MLAERLLAPVRAAEVDTLVLGCTHYPLLARTIADVMGPRGGARVERRGDRVRGTCRRSRVHRAGDHDRRDRVQFVTSGDVANVPPISAHDSADPRSNAVEAWSVELTVLGCSGSYGAPAGGACSGYLVRAGDANIWMDCGNGTFANLHDTSIPAT